MTDGHTALTIVKASAQNAVTTHLIPKHWTALTDRMFNYFPTTPERRDLLPLDDLRAMLPTLDALAAPAQRNEAVSYMTMLVGAYPHVNVPDLEIYTKTLIQYAQKYPPKVLETGVYAMLRTLKFPPTIQELTEALDKIMLPLATAASRAKRMIELHSECDKLEAQRVEQQRQFEADDAAFRAANGGKSRSEVAYDKAMQRRAEQNAPRPAVEPWLADLPDAPTPETSFKSVGDVTGSLANNGFKLPDNEGRA